MPSFAFKFLGCHHVGFDDAIKLPNTKGLLLTDNGGNRMKS